jgi:SAM-dependent methyltransferase
MGKIVIDTAMRLRHDRIFNKIFQNLTLKKRGILLDIGSSNQKRYYRFFPNYLIETLDIDKTVNPTYVADIQFEKPNKKYDIIIAFQVLEHIPDTDKALNNISKLLTDKGLFIASIPMFYSIHGIDYNRYTDRALKHHLSKFFKNMEITPFGNPYFYFLKCISKTPIVGIGFNLVNPLLENLIRYDSKTNPNGFFIIARNAFQ